MLVKIAINTKLLIQVVMVVFVFTACKKAVETDPPDSLILEKEAFANDASAVAVVSGIYTAMRDQFGFSQGVYSIGFLTGLAGDELRGISDEPFGLFYKNALTPVTFSTAYFWQPIYSLIYTCNISLEGIASSKGMSVAVKRQLAAEVKFMRAFLYFQLTNLFGDVPMPTSSDYRVNRALPRTSATQVYKQIVEDLKAAEEELGSSFVDGFGRVVAERVRPSKWAAAAMLAKVYLYTGDWANAEGKAGTVLDNPSFILEPDPDSVFLPTSKEAIFQVQMYLNNNPWDARVYNLISVPDAQHPAAFTGGIMNWFETGDLRSLKWIGQSVVWVSDTVRARIYYYPWKYKMRYVDMTDYLMVLRLAEQYLIRAEARAQLNNLAGAKADLDAVRSRAELAGITANTKQEMLDAVAHERQVELFTEWGNRWFDLKRTGAIDGVMMNAASEKGSVWNTNYKLFPIPQSEISANSNLVQNPGY
jgi:hypothetical protein